MRVPFRSFAMVAGAAMFLAACGTDPGERAVSGGLLGAGAGAAIGAAAGNPGAGALIGGLGGAALGAGTSPRQIDLGPPLWRHGERYGSWHRSHYAHRYVCHHTSADEKVCRRVASR